MLQSHSATADCGCGCGAATACDVGGCDAKGCDTGGCPVAAPSLPSCGVASGGCDAGCDAVELPSACESITAPSCDTCCDSCTDGCGLDNGCKLFKNHCTGGASCGCLQCCSGWRFTAESLFLRRGDGGPERLISSQVSGQTIVDSQNLEYDHQAVPRFNLTRDYCNCWGWDIGYFGTDAWNTSAQNDPRVSPILLGPGLPFASTAPGTVFAVEGGTDLHSAEFNLRRRCHECVTLVAGFRWIELDDSLRGYSVAPITQDFYSLRTVNHMYGFQLGADATLLTTSKGRLDAITRAGLMGNHIDHRGTTPLGIGGLTNRVSAEADDTSFLAEFGLRGVVPISSCWSVVAGYHLFWLDGVALAPQQLRTTSLLAPGAAAIDAGSTLFLHGASVGVQARF